jgi:hypothetical protein
MSSAQYIPEISGYHLYWYELNEGQQPPITDKYYVFNKDTSLVLSWERGDETIPEYNTPYTGNYIEVNAIVNSPELWTDSVANVQKDVTLSDGIYELTVTEADTNEYESGHSQPIYVEIKTKYARVQINLNIE